MEVSSWRTLISTIINSDLAFKTEDISKNPDTPNSLRAPERLFDSPLDQSIDIWSFGCLVFEILAGCALFPIMPDDHDDCHILMIIDQLGPLPEQLFSQWDQSHIYFLSNSTQNSIVDESDMELLKDISFATRFHEEKGCEIDDNEEESVIDILRQILRYEPEKRPSAKELLCHPWFADNSA